MNKLRLGTMWLVNYSKSQARNALSDLSVQFCKSIAWQRVRLSGSIRAEVHSPPAVVKMTLRFFEARH